ncbi:MAG: hypothetical protein ABFS39_05690 [Pseudomonadota bacterium]
MSNEQTTWADLAIDLYDKLTGRGAEITYHFEDFEIDVPDTVATEPKYAKWRFNGVVKIRTRDDQNKG